MLQLEDVDNSSENPRVGGSNPPLGTITILFRLTIKHLVKVGHSGIPRWDNHSFRPCSHFAMPLAASSFWRAPLV
jgi:hypothetical protein